MSRITQELKDEIHDLIVDRLGIGHSIETIKGAIHKSIRSRMPKMATSDSDKVRECIDFLCDLGRGEVADPLKAFILRAAEMSSALHDSVRLREIANSLRDHKEEEHDDPPEKWLLRKFMSIVEATSSAKAAWVLLAPFVVWLVWALLAKPSDNRLWTLMLAEACAPDLMIAEAQVKDLLEKNHSTEELSRLHSPSLEDRLNLLRDHKHSSPLLKVAVTLELSALHRKNDSSAANYLEQAGEQLKSFEASTNSNRMPDYWRLMGRLAHFKDDDLQAEQHFERAKQNSVGNGIERALALGGLGRTYREIAQSERRNGRYDSFCTYLTKAFLNHEEAIGIYDDDPNGETQILSVMAEFERTSIAKIYASFYDENTGKPDPNLPAACGKHARKSLNEIAMMLRKSLAVYEKNGSLRGQAEANFELGRIYVLKFFAENNDESRTTAEDYLASAETMANRHEFKRTLGLIADQRDKLRAVGKEDEGEEEE